MSLSLAHRGASPWLKAALTFGLVVLADVLLSDEMAGSTLALLPLAALASVVVAHAALRRDRRALAALAAAAFAILLLADRPNLVGWVMAWTALAVAVLSPRAPNDESAVQWAVRLLWVGLAGLLAPFKDALRMMERRIKGSFLRAVLASILPVAGGAVFFCLFALANPIIDHWLDAWRLPALSFPRLLIWIVFTFAGWTLLRPRGLRRKARSAAARPVSFSIGGSIVASLLVFNAIFALQNILDVAFLWSGAPLPDGVTFAEYAHRGAYLLIVTALLAGAFVLVFLRPGAPEAERPLIRRLVTLWVAQNLVLVASSALRTLDYVEAYGLTRLRISALAWMALVALGLVLICARLLRNRSAAWLVNWNFAAMVATLIAAAVIDLAVPAATWNVRHAREVAGRGPSLDLCYLAELGDAAILPLIEIERTPTSPALRNTATSLRLRQIEHLRQRQGDWRTWTWRGQRRLAAAEQELAIYLLPDSRSGPTLDCDWTRPPALLPPAPPLTPPAETRS